VDANASAWEILVSDLLSSNLRSLPEHNFCADQVVNETANKLERFIYDNEPAGAEDAKEFRDGLLAVLNEARGDWESESCQCAKCRAVETTDNAALFDQVMRALRFGLGRGSPTLESDLRKALGLPEKTSVPPEDPHDGLIVELNP
jgi:hypothetical protein